MQQRQGKYELLKQIGRGAMATVFRARHTGTGQTLALKVLTPLPGQTPEQQERQIARFQREAQAMAGLSHPNIVTVYDLGEQDGRHFLAMEYLEGTTLRAYLDEQLAPLSAAQAYRILVQVADALEAIHQRGLVHRDLKPSNVMLLASGRVKLLDFGVARQQGEASLTEQGMVVGSPAYMSPEQVRGERCTPASDIWSLGVLLWEMLVGHAPFAAETVPAVLYQVLHKRPAPPEGASLPVQRVLRRALEKRAKRRYSSAGEFAEALRAALAAPEGSCPKRPRQWARLSLLGAAVSGAAWAAWQPVLGPAAGRQSGLVEAVAVPRNAIPRITAPPMATIPPADALAARALQEPMEKAPMMLMITGRKGSSVAGTMTVKTQKGMVRLPVVGMVSPKTGQISLWRADGLSVSDGVN